MSAKKTPKKSAKASPKNKPASKAAGTASPAHQVGDLDKSSSLNDKHPLNIATKGDIGNNSDGTQPLDSKVVALAQEIVNDSDNSDTSAIK